MPANQTFSVTLSLKDADTVKRGLEQLGTSGQNALKRLESATTPASRALQVLNQASGAVQGGMSELASRSGAAGEALASLGKGGLAAAAALGAVAVAIAAAVNAANAATEHFGDIADAAERAGTSAENFQTLQRVAEANASSAEELGTAMETLKVKISEAAEGNAEAQRAFESAGISMQRLGEIGGDTALVLNEMSKNGASAAEMADLLGRGAKGLSPTMQALNGDLEATKQNLLELGLIASNDTVASFDELADRGVSRLNEEFAKWAPALLAVAKGMETLREEAYMLLDALKPAIEWTDWFWQKYSQIARTLAANPMGPFVGPMAKNSEPVQALTDQAKFPQLRMPTQTQISIAPPVVKGGGRRAGGGGGGKSEAVHDAERDADAIADLRKEIELFGRTRDAAIDKATSRLSDHASADQIAEVKDLAGQLYDLGEAQKAASEAEREHQQLLSEGKSLYEAMRTPAEEYAATLARLNELQSADVITPTTYNRALDDAKEKLDAITQKTAEANAESGKWFDQLQLNTNLISTTSSTLSGMFTEAFMGERKLADVLAEIPGLITKIIMQKMIELAITLAIQSLTLNRVGCISALPIAA